jgi:hypothetical protein
MRLAIADPPYPPRFTERHDRADGSARVVARSRAQRWYSDQGVRGATDRPADHHADASEWDDPARHRLLLEQLMDEFDGWAIATPMDGVECYRPLPIPCRVMVWYRRNAQRGDYCIANVTEAVIVYPPVGRRAKGSAGPTGQVVDLLDEPAPIGGFAGMKPARWTRWVLDAMSHQPDDEVVDLFPGSGSVGAAISQGVLL